MPASTGSLHAARVHQFGALVAGSDAAPMHGDCVFPVCVELRGVESDLLSRLRQWRDSDHVDYAEGYGHIGGYRPQRKTTAYVTVRCRKCPPCLKARAKLWATRGSVELRAATRSWFGTLTYSPEERFRVRCRADQEASAASVAWSCETDAEQFRRMAKVIRRDFQLFVKRVRKASRARVRYLMTTEAHADGFPHLHLMLHEYDGRVTKRLLEQQWPHGITHFRLVNASDHKVPWYVAKYLTKSILAKPIASLRYGQPPLGAITELMSSVARAASATRRSSL